MKDELDVTVYRADGESLDRRLEEGPIVIGRSTANGLAISDAKLSRQHARLLKDEKGWSVEDLGSHNGTFLNGERLIKPERLKPGDVLILGESRIVVKAFGGKEAPGEVQTTTFFRSAAELLDQGKVNTLTAGDKEIRVHAERLRLLNEVHGALSRSISLNELLPQILDRVFEHLRPQEGAIYLRSPDGSMTCAARRSSGTPNAAPFYSTHLVREVAEKGMAALVMDVLADERFSEAESVAGVGMRSVVAAPLLDSEGSLGMIVMASGLASRRFVQEDMELLTTLASAAALRIRNVALAEEAAESRRLAAEIALARRIQESLLPAELPAVPGWELFAVNRPSRFVSGDFYTAVMRDDPIRLAVMVADVAGKGMAASLLAASLEALCAGPLESGLPPQDVFTRVSQRLFARTPPEKFATAFLGVLDPATGELQCANAGHCPPLILEEGGGRRWLRGAGMPLGLIDGATYSQLEIVLGPADVLVLFTDGFTEAINPSEEEFGAERLAEVLARSSGSPLGEVAASLERELDLFTAGAPFSDDRTLVLLRRTD